MVAKIQKKTGNRLPHPLINVKRMAFSFNRPKCVHQFGKTVTSQKRNDSEYDQENRPRDSTCSILD